MSITASSMGGSHDYGPKTPEAIAKREEAARQAEAAKREAEKVDLSELDNGFTLLQYQLAAHNTAIYPEVGTGSLVALTYLFLKLNGEAGEAAEKFAKIIRDKGGKGTPEDREEILKEIGDVLWYCAMLADELDASLEDVAQANVAKLKSRQERGVLGGSGDNR
jgi:NTP pyrophosphatase (non-canonical NTP hydrolase)